MNRKFLIGVLVVSATMMSACGPSWKEVKCTDGVCRDLRPGHKNECWGEADNEPLACPDWARSRQH